MTTPGSAPIRAGGRAGASEGGWLAGPRGTALVSLLFLGLAAVFTWPAVCFDPQVLVTRHFDLYVAIWLLEQAAESLPRLFVDGSAWPQGESLVRSDSFSLLFLGWAGRGLLSGWFVVTLITWLAPALNALAAEACARRVLEVRRPWSLLAGLAFGFSGIAASVVLEGHVYQLLAFWLPLLLLAAWCTPERGLPWKRGLLVGLLWALSLFSSAYFGVLASALLLVVAAARPRRSLRLMPFSALVILPVGGWYLWVYSMGSQHAITEIKPDLVLAVGAATVASLSTWTPQLDLLGHSVGAPIGFTAFWLLLFSPLLLRGSRGWRALALLAIVALLACFGSQLRLVDGGASLPSPFALVARIPGVEVFRFPVRIVWLYTLCGGLVASACLQALSRRLPTALLLPALLLATVDGVVGTGLLWRVRQAIAEVPGAYQAAPRDLPVLDTFGRSLDGTSGELEMWTRNLACYYQASHRRPILELCVRTERQSPREALDARLSHGLLSATGPDAAQQLDDLRLELERAGLGAVAVHADFYRPNDRQVLLAGLEDLLGEPLADTRDGGERVVLFLVQAEAAPRGAVER